MPPASILPSGRAWCPLMAVSQAAQIRRSLRRTARPDSRSVSGIDSLHRSQNWTFMAEEWAIMERADVGLSS